MANELTFRKFYQCFPDLEIVNSCVHNLTWTYFLSRNISTQYYYRLLQSPKKEAVIDEMKQKASQLPKTQFELVKSPVVGEFLGFKDEDSYLESDFLYAASGADRGRRWRT